MQEAQKESNQEVQVVIEDVIAMLDDCKTREEIRLHYGLTKSDLTLLFKDEALKGQKQRRRPGFVIVKREVSNLADNGSKAEDIIFEETVKRPDIENGPSTTTEGITEAVKEETPSIHNDFKTSSREEAPVETPVEAQDNQAEPELTQEELDAMEAVGEVPKKTWGL